MDIADPGLHRCADLGRQLARQICLPLSHQTIVVVGAGVAFTPEGVELGNEFPV